MTDAAELLDLLPGELAIIAERIGLPATLHLVERYGGRRLYVPESVDADHALVKLLGTEATQALCSYYPGERLEVPKADGYARAVRNAHIRRGRAQGISQAKLAGEHRLTERQIRNIEYGLVEDGQLGLF